MPSSADHCSWLVAAICFCFAASGHGAPAVIHSFSQSICWAESRSGSFGGIASKSSLCLSTARMSGLSSGLPGIIAGLSLSPPSMRSARVRRSRPPLILASSSPWQERHFSAKSGQTRRTKWASASDANVVNADARSSEESSRKRFISEVSMAGAADGRKTDFLGSKRAAHAERPLSAVVRARSELCVVGCGRPGDFQVDGRIGEV